jgi:two-component system heavy metal sensor histidine kinase CusS
MLDRLAESFERLTRFSSEIAHELRTPINNLRGEVEVAFAKPRSAEEYREALGSALEECDRLARMIDGLLFLARAEHPTAQTSRDPLDLTAEMEMVRAFYDAAAAEAGIQLRVSFADRLMARLDRALFQRALGNLVANALAHTPRGGTVTLSARADARGVAVEVADSGCGIDAAHLPFLFDRFYRVDRSRSSATGNVGLGLAIVKGIVELHGGSVDVESRVGSGTRFVLHFPSE